MNIHYGKAVLSIHECHKGDIYFFTTLRELNPDSGVSIRTSRTSRRFMNFITETMETTCIIYFCGNHSNLFDASVMASVFTDNVILSRLLFVLHFIGESFWKVNDFIRVARRYCLGIIKDDKGEGQVSMEQFRSEAESLLFINSQVLCTHYNLCFEELHQSSLMSGVPMGAIFITER